MILDLSYVNVRIISIVLSAGILSATKYWLALCACMQFKLCAIYCFSTDDHLNIRIWVSSCVSSFLSFFSPQCRSFLDDLPFKVFSLTL